MTLHDPFQVSDALQPLAHRLRPKTLGEFSGQEKILGKGTPLRQWIESDRIPPLLFWGPPGCGKTTLGCIIAEMTKAKFVLLSAVSAGTKDLKQAGEEAAMQRSLHQRPTVLFVDEIHRFSKSQQDVLLPYVESGTLTLIGATTENPSFELNSALLSRLRVIRFESLTQPALVEILRRGSRGAIHEDALQKIAELANGDARRALTDLEGVLSLRAAQPEADHVDLYQRLLSGSARTVRYDKSGEEHYNVISAFIKSMRDSDEDATLYYLARLIEGGEDPLFIARRMVVFASEDVGVADGTALQVAIAAKDSVDFIGMPEGRIPLAHAALTLARAPKDNSAYIGISEALAEVQTTGALPIPMNLRNPVTAFMRGEGYGKGYRYAHDDPTGAAKQPHLPVGISKSQFVPKRRERA